MKHRYLPSPSTQGTEIVAFLPEASEESQHTGVRYGPAPRSPDKSIQPCHPKRILVLHVPDPRPLWRVPPVGLGRATRTAGHNTPRNWPRYPRQALPRIGIPLIATPPGYPKGCSAAYPPQWRAPGHPTLPDKPEPHHTPPTHWAAQLTGRLKSPRYTRRPPGRRQPGHGRPPLGRLQGSPPLLPGRTRSSATLPAGTVDPRLPYPSALPEESAHVALHNCPDTVPAQATPTE
ncbi:MAG: hypothetical protein BWY09_01590 [Candidatus Hydrogenedentes bacterium ADurb.Bin179]|nr:MAG: hypothetical protein BWY09_01590 [Candidatus Hydrogenedentes bacterium ADurb.Bin179]